VPNPTNSLISKDSKIVSKLISEIRAQFASSLVEVNYFGKGAVRSIWVTQEGWRRLAGFLKKELQQTEEQSHPFESLFVFKLDDEWVITFSLKNLFYVRCSFSSRAIESLSDLWPLASVFEEEAVQKHQIKFLRTQ
jgi:hypothetical protein